MWYTPQPQYISLLRLPFRPPAGSHGFRVKDLEVSEFRVLGLQDPGFRVRGSGFRVFRPRGLGLLVGEDCTYRTLLGCQGFSPRHALRTPRSPLSFPSKHKQAPSLLTHPALFKLVMIHPVHCGCCFAQLCFSACTSRMYPSHIQVAFQSLQALF